MQPPLVDLLGATWSLDATVNALAWSGGHACFALTDGSVAIARTGWAGAPVLRPRPGGGVELLQAEGLPPPLVRASVSRGPCLALAGSAGGFLTGGADGRLRRVDLEGNAERIAKFDDGPVIAVVSGTHDWACIAGRMVYVGDGAALPALGEPLALAMHETEGLAVAHAAGVSLYRGGARYRHGAIEPSRRLAFSPGGDQLAAGAMLWRLGQDSASVLEDAEVDPHDVAFSADGNLLAHAGEGGVRCWRADAPAAAPVRVSRMPARAMAFHPRRALIAIAHANGAVTLGPPRAGEVLLLQPQGAPMVHTLAFDHSGAWLAMGGVACMLAALPDLLFREPALRGATE